MIVEVEDLIAHKKYDQELPENADIEKLLHLIGYKDLEAYHMVNGKHEPMFYKLCEGDKVAVILALGGG